uniref:Uncharacterized protein n=1 Tax=Brassica oleracea TaxID=3712 RepID=A0A3P6DUA6_BRAOL|nr:unnamed protein product [Brassica oleracea]
MCQHLLHQKVIMIKVIKMLELSMLKSFLRTTKLYMSIVLTKEKVKLDQANI